MRACSRSISNGVDNEKGIKTMILLDGKKLAKKILTELKQERVKIKKAMRCAIVAVGADKVTETYLREKQKFAAELDIDFKVHHYSETISTDELRKQLKTIVHLEKNRGVVIQLPLPKHINTQYVLSAVTPEKDIDMLSARAVGNFVVGLNQRVAQGKSSILPPVVGAVKVLLNEYTIDYKSKYIVVVGAGRLVGKPLALWLLNEKATFSVVRSTTPDISEFTKKADIVISGVGKSKLITGDMIKEGAVVIDCGTSESGGAIAGDVDVASVSEKVAYLAPVPGGVGPLAVAMLFKNLITLAKGEKEDE
ncbi:MAG: bifunctional 5,10-methylenetetrahydrofolate dehydrogenase/5,10-methenyltetrahydrofolate cyclohydrolase [bacterium]|nr:bifunctional 5,10-methylenetetrahydrofolate dehydrogenase/5,10-methenyltetrahydrofolate cyclohydrolase [bacterium]